jgi:hypothetical protein
MAINAPMQSTTGHVPCHLDHPAYVYQHPLARMELPDLPLNASANPTHQRISLRLGGRAR